MNSAVKTKRQYLKLLATLIEYNYLFVTVIIYVARMCVL